MSDLIRREDVIGMLKELEVVESDNFTKTDPVTMMIVATIADCIEGIVELPSAEPERKRGEWIVHDYALGRERYECSECKGRCDLGYDFCPNCGADMRGGNENA